MGDDRIKKNFSVGYNSSDDEENSNEDSSRNTEQITATLERMTVGDSSYVKVGSIDDAPFLLCWRDLSNYSSIQNGSDTIFVCKQITAHLDVIIIRSIIAIKNYKVVNVSNNKDLGIVEIYTNMPKTELINLN